MLSSGSNLHPHTGVLLITKKEICCVVYVAKELRCISDSEALSLLNHVKSAQWIFYGQSELPIIQQFDSSNKI